MKKTLLFLIRIYQHIFSFDYGVMSKLFPNTKFCRHIPTCSQYGYQAIDKYGVIKGGWLAVKRVFRCVPWKKCSYDPVP